MEKCIKIKVFAIMFLVNFMIAIVLLSGCNTTRKATESTLAKTSEQAREVRSLKENEQVNESKDVNSELETTTEVDVTEYYEPIDSGQKGAVKAVRSIRTVTTKKDSDKSKIATTSEKKEDTSIKNATETEVKSVKVEKIKKGVAQWKIFVVAVAFLLMVYFLVRKNIIRIPFLTKIVERINRLLSL